MKSIRSFFRHFRFSMFLVSILCVLLGVALILWEAEAKQVFCYAFGGILILSGLLEAVMYIASENKNFVQKVMFFGGVIAAVAGVWILFSPGQVLMLAVIVLGIVLIYHGGMDMKYAYDLKRCESKRWTLCLFCGLLTAAIGIFLLVLSKTLEENGVLFIIVAVGFIFDGVTDFFTVFAVANNERRYELYGGKPAELIEGNATVVDALPVVESSETSENTENNEMEHPQE